MRHRTAGRQFGRNSSHRRALFRNLVTSLLDHGRIETTEAKAKEIKSIADKMVTLGKRGDLHAKRMAFAYIQSRDVVAKLFDEIAPASATRNGGYTRVIKTRVRLGDSAPMAIIELVDVDLKLKKEAAPAPDAAAPAEKPKKVKKVKTEAAPSTRPTPGKKASGAPAAQQKRTKGSSKV